MEVVSGSHETISVCEPCYEGKMSASILKWSSPDELTGIVPRGYRKISSILRTATTESWLPLTATPTEPSKLSRESR